MAEQDLRAALARYEAAGELVRIREPIDWRFEAAAVLWRLDRGPAVVFEQVIDHEIPLVGNVLNQHRKLAIALGLEDQELQPRLVEAITRRFPPTEVEDAPCQTHVRTDEIDLLSQLPVPLISEHDGGRYLSAGMLISRDPVSGRQNMAICRMAVSEGDRLGVYMAPTNSSQFLAGYRDLGRSMPVAVALGVHPAIQAASQYLVPDDELEIAGGILGEPLRVTRGRTVDLQIPAEAEIVLEGSIDPEVAQAEGPFGEFPATYAPRRENPVIELSAVTTRDQPMLQMICGGNHPEHLITGSLAREATLLQAVKAVVPGTHRVSMPQGGACRFHALISIRQRTPGEAKLAALAAFAAQDLLKHVVVVDHDIDVTDPVQVEWAIATRMRAHEDLLILPGIKSNPVDPMALNKTITKVIVDATLAVTDKADRPVKPGVPQEVADRLEARWHRLLPDP